MNMPKKGLVGLLHAEKSKGKSNGLKAYAKARAKAEPRILDKLFKATKKKKLLRLKKMY